MPTPCKNPVLRLLRGSRLVVDTNQIVVNNAISEKVVGKGGYRTRPIWRQGLDRKAYRANATKPSDKPLHYHIFAKIHTQECHLHRQSPSPIGIKILIHCLRYSYSRKTQHRWIAEQWPSRRRGWPGQYTQYLVNFFNLQKYVRHANTIPEKLPEPYDTD